MVHLEWCSLVHMLLSREFLHATGTAGLILTIGGVDCMVYF